MLVGVDGTGLWGCGVIYLMGDRARLGWRCFRQWHGWWIFGPLRGTSRIAAPPLLQDLRRVQNLRQSCWCGGAAIRHAPRKGRYCAEFKICANPVGAGLSREEAGTGDANRRAQPCQPPHKSARKQTKRERSDSPAVALAVDLDLALDLPATSGGRVEVLRREVEAMDGRKALRPRMGRTARSSRSKTGAREPAAKRRAGCRSKRFLVTFFQEKK
ncbi:hypothetical protein J2W83_002510 [Pseudomonas hunanensis]|uniref:Uncharacterized protein n=1 Tax=Pseudomonas hunanensis TaxID=1247546 RepID=A0ACC6K393_9PSED|nr:hypothetical protein [Pseudomonas hunanensis]